MRVFLCKYNLAKECNGKYKDCTDCILDKIRTEITDWQTDIHDNECDAESHDFVFERIYEIIDEYKQDGMSR